MKWFIRLQGLWYHYVTSHGIPDYYWLGERFIHRVGPVHVVRLRNC